MRALPRDPSEKREYSHPQLRSQRRDELARLETRA
jgi:hypothetical protein